MYVHDSSVLFQQTPQSRVQLHCIHQNVVRPIRVSSTPGPRFGANARSELKFRAFPAESAPHLGPAFSVQEGGMAARMNDFVQSACLARDLPVRAEFHGTSTRGERGTFCHNDINYCRT
jgi:hypothetical protein